MNDLRQLRRDEWPPLINEIAEHIGDEAAMDLFVRFAGRKLNIPKNIPADHVIASVIGEEKAQKLSRTFDRETVDFPTGRCLLNKARNRRIFEAYKGGVPQGDLAVQHRLSQRQISDIIRQQFKKQEKSWH